MSISKVWIEEGCTACGLCEDTCPEVFEMEDIAVVKADAVFDGNEDAIIEAAEGCPVEVIKYEE
jgi:ferredoxin